MQTVFAPKGATRTAQGESLGLDNAQSLTKPRRGALIGGSQRGPRAAALGHPSAPLRGGEHLRLTPPSCRPCRGSRRRSGEDGRGHDQPGGARRHQPGTAMAGQPAERRRRLRPGAQRGNAADLRPVRHGLHVGRKHARPRTVRRARRAGRRLPAGQRPAQRLHRRADADDPRADVSATASPRSSWPSATACPSGRNSATNSAWPSS